jgi:hypothetical protein
MASSRESVTGDTCLTIVERGVSAARERGYDRVTGDTLLITTIVTIAAIYSCSFFFVVAIAAWCADSVSCYIKRFKFFTTF